MDIQIYCFFGVISDLVTELQFFYETTNIFHNKRKGFSGVQ